MAVLGLRFHARAFSSCGKRGHSSSQCAGLSHFAASLVGSTGSRRAGSVTVAHGPSCSAACGTFPDQGSNLCPLHWQADSQPLCHQGSPVSDFWDQEWVIFYRISLVTCTFSWWDFGLFGNSYFLFWKDFFGNFRHLKDISILTLWRITCKRSSHLHRAKHFSRDKGCIHLH